MISILVSPAQDVIGTEFSSNQMLHMAVKPSRLSQLSFDVALRQSDSAHSLLMYTANRDRLAIALSQGDYCNSLIIGSS